MKCEYCGAEDSEENPVELQPNPYALELYGNDTEYWLCEECAIQCSRDV